MESNVNKESFSVLGKYNIERIKVKSAVDMLLESPDVRSVVVVKEVPKKIYIRIMTHQVLLKCNLFLSILRRTRH